MKLRLINKDGKYELLFRNGKNKKLSNNDVLDFIRNFNRNEYCHVIGGWPHRDFTMDDYGGIVIAHIDNDANLVIENAEEFCKILDLDVKYITATEYAERYEKKRGIIARFCREGRLPGAKQKGGTWLIPEDCPYPRDSRTGKKQF